MLRAVRSFALHLARLRNATTAFFNKLLGSRMFVRGLVFELARSEDGCLGVGRQLMPVSAAAGDHGANEDRGQQHRRSDREGQRLVGRRRRGLFGGGVQEMVRDRINGVVRIPLCPR